MLLLIIYRQNKTHEYMNNQEIMNNISIAGILLIREFRGKFSQRRCEGGYE
jgi:hypothetical protein